MNPRLRGLLFFGGFLVFAIIVCGFIPFVLMPGGGTGVALPVIQVPGEIVTEGGFFGMDLTNTIIGTILTNILVLLIAGILWRVTRGWTKEVPGRAQAFFEMFVETFYNFMKGIGGDKLRGTPGLWFITATLFFFLLTANYMKLLPGVETVGKTHCAYAGTSGYPAIAGDVAGTARLWVSQPLNAGMAQSEETYKKCTDFFYGYFTAYPADDTLLRIQTELSDAEALMRQAEEQIAAAATETELAEAQDAYDLAKAEKERQEVRLAAAEEIDTLKLEIEAIEAEISALEGGEDAEASAEGETVLVQEGGAAEGEDHGGGTEEAIAALEAELSVAEDALLTARTQVVYPFAMITLSETELASGVVPYLFHITPFVRGPATDLSLTIGLAVLVVVLIQAWGVWALGPAYFEKFINLSALGNVGKRPLGIIDFIVGLIEIISEISKIISLGFRLFGNLFAGGVALMAVTFLLAIAVPGVIFGLELIIGLVQALVFAVLTLVFAVQAQESHHHDDAHHDDAHGEGHEAHADAH